MITDIQLHGEMSGGKACGPVYLADPEFVGECAGARAEVDYWWPIVAGVEAHPGRVAGFKAMAAATGQKVGQVKKIFYLWFNAGRDWRQLIDRAKYPAPGDAAFPHAFVQFFRDLYCSLQRDQTGSEAVRQIYTRRAAWEMNPFSEELAIPGYDEAPRVNPLLGYPNGWSERNLRKLLPNKLEKAMRRQGPKHASEFLPNIYTTRVGLDIGQIIYFDDQWHDTYVNLTGVNKKALRPQSFNGLDALTGFAFEPGLKPQVWDEEKSKRTELNQLDFFWYVMSVLTTYGYNSETGTILIFEHGTANVDKRDRNKTTDHFDQLIEDVTGGKVRVDRSGIWRAPAFKEMLFEGKPTGNFRFKAPIESWFGLLRNYSAALPAPTGMNRDRAPEESHGLLMANEKMLKLADSIPRERFAALKREVLEWEDYTRAHRLIVRAINRRPDHALEGWRKLGFTGIRYRLGLDQPWIADEEWQLIPAETRDVYRHIVTRPGYNDPFLLSPEQAFESLRSKLTRLPLSKVPLLAPERAWEDIRVGDPLEMKINGEYIDSEPLRYIARVWTPQGYEVHLERGKTYKRLLNIFDPSKLWIAEAQGSRKGAFIGVANLIQPACKIDSDGIHAQLGEVAHVRSLQTKAVTVRTESEAGARLARRDYNRDVLAHGTAAERQRDEEHALDITDFTPDEPASTPKTTTLDLSDFF